MLTDPPHQSMDVKQSHDEGTDRQADRQTQSGTDIATTRPKRPKGQFGEKSMDPKVWELYL